ncbi:uncharacterized protein LOC103313264 isoform X1 [Tribolium castaneum]|uniref:uncharacterized protein LOC103313264 isoform X1 n=1 Tax=Tribolium castaneum TaxID=7070 RepID=UPI00046C2751|nr:PREDICTED: uncharacterized protein LOC103313264 isoform X1 [Tribolium castaneum]|eukprot:XP_008194330.1 PREDICTED: uncharacterized protein LOC103313264 isoform X1 [Tribolium castaneum]
MFLATVFNSVKKLCCCCCSQQLDEDNVITESVEDGGVEQNFSAENISPNTYAENFRNSTRNRQELKPCINSQQRKFDDFVDKNVDEDNLSKRVHQQIPQVHQTQTVYEKEKTGAKFTHYADDFQNRRKPKPLVISQQPFNRRFDFFVDKNVDEDKSTTRVFREIPQVHHTRTVHEDVPEKSAEFYRRKAQRHFDKKRQFHKIAHQCKENGEHSLADHYFKKAKLQARLAETANNNAAAVVLQENQARNFTKSTIDLHHLYVKEALEALDRFLDQEIQFLRNNSLKRGSLRVITGRGKHSANGIPKIKPAVIARLEERNLKYNHINPGYLRVVISKNSEFGNSAFRTSPLRL